MKVPVIACALILVFSSCRSTRKIQTAVAPRDTTIAPVVKVDTPMVDSGRIINDAYAGLMKNQVTFNSFSAKIDVDYNDGEGKKYNLTAHVRMQKDSVIWISIRAILGIEGIRALITKDSVKLLDKQNDIYTARSVAYLQEVTALPLDLSSLQDLLLGNPVFIDSHFVSYNQTPTTVSLVNVGEFFKTLLTLNKADYTMQSSKLDDVDEIRNRTCYLSYEDYEDKKGFKFSTKRQISVTEKKKLDIKLDFKQYDFNETLSFPFSVPRNFKTN